MYIAQRALRDGAWLDCGLVAFAFCVASPSRLASPGVASLGVPWRRVAEYMTYEGTPKISSAASLAISPHLHVGMDLAYVLDDILRFSFPFLNTCFGSYVFLVSINFGTLNPQNAVYC